MVTYNVLADSYVSRPNAKSVFGYCSPRRALVPCLLRLTLSSVSDLDIDVRKQLVLKELLGYHADIVCLQECDQKVFDTYYRPHLQAEGHVNGRVPLLHLSCL